MSFAYYTRTFSVDPSAAPSRFSSVQEIEALLEAVWNEAAASGGPEFRLVHGSSRGGSVLEMAKGVTGALSMPELGFLHGAGEEEFETSASLMKPVILRGAERDRAAARMENALSHLATHPELAADLGDFPREDAIEAFGREYGEGLAIVDLNDVCDGDEGTSGQYLAAYLKCVARILREARLHDRVVVHVCDLEGEFSLRGLDAPQGELRLPPQFVAAIPWSEGHFRITRVDIRLKDGRKFFGVQMNQGVVSLGLDPRGVPLPVPFAADEVLEVRPARPGLKAALGLW